MSVYGGRPKTRRQIVMSDGRLKKHSRAEVFCEEMIRGLGYVPIKDWNGEAPVVEIPHHWTPYPHSIPLSPDHRVDVRLPIVPTSDAVETLRKVILVDGHHFHHRTVKQEKRDARHDVWYLRANFYVVHVGAEEILTVSGREMVLPQLAAALKSKVPLITIPIEPKKFKGEFV